MTDERAGKPNNFGYRMSGVKTMLEGYFGFLGKDSHQQRLTR